MGKKLYAFVLCCAHLMVCPISVVCRVLDFLNDFSAIPFDKSIDACRHNSELLEQVLAQNASNNVLLFPVNYTFHLQHGIVAYGVNNTVIQLDGTLRFEKSDASGIDSNEILLACITIVRSQNVTITSSHRGLIDGRGSQYWGIPLIGYERTREHRPRLLRFNLTEELLIENIVLQDAPYHTLYLDAVNHVEVRNISIIARRTYQDGHGWVDMTAFNTDGIDVSGHNVWIHDCDIWVQDDCIAVKDVKNHSGIPYHPVSSNMTFERINATGLGFTIGSIQGTHVKNITFRNSYLHRTVKGIYMKFSYPKRQFVEENLHALVENVLYENITMESPMQWPIWIGPAQQADNRDFCHPNPCSLCWPMAPGSKCHVVPENKFRNISLRNIRINNPKMSPGVIYGSDLDTIDNIIFENVQVTHGRPLPISLLDIHATFPGTMQPIHDSHVPSYFAHAEQKVENFFDRIRDAILRFKDTIENARSTYSTAAVNLVQKSGGSEQWYLALLGQAALGSTWMWVFLSFFTGVMTCCVVLHWRRFSHSDATQGSKWLYHGMYFALFIAFSISCFCSSVMPFHKPKWQRTDRYFECRGVRNGIAKGSTWPVPSCFREEYIPTTFAKNQQSTSFWAIPVELIGVICIAFAIVTIVYFKTFFQNTSRATFSSEIPNEDGVETVTEDETQRLNIADFNSDEQPQQNQQR